MISTNSLLSANNEQDSPKTLQIRGQKIDYQQERTKKVEAEKTA
jgi:hypothetical protein